MSICEDKLAAFKGSRDSRAPPIFLPPTHHSSGSRQTLNVVFVEASDRASYNPEFFPVILLDLPRGNELSFHLHPHASITLHTLLLDIFALCCCYLGMPPCPGHLCTYAFSISGFPALGKPGSTCWRDCSEVIFKYFYVLNPSPSPPPLSPPAPPRSSHPE